MIWSLYSWIPCTTKESWALGLNPLIPWPEDQVKGIMPICHLRLFTLVERSGWGEARKCPEVMRLTRSNNNG
jgi:hypothetical protein